MTIVRSPRPDSGFTILPNAALNDQRLSWKARGLLAHLLSKPPLWRTSSRRLALDGPDGRDAVRTGLQELEQVGYLVRDRIQDAATGRWSTLSTVFDTPQCGQPVHNPPTEAGLSDAGKPGPLEKTDRVSTDVVTSHVTTRRTVDNLCNTCSGSGIIHYCGEVETCPECEAR